MFKTFNGAHQWLLGLEKRKKTAYSTKQIRGFFKSLGNPQDSYKVVHVGGTSGKGSVCQMLASILIEAGYKVGVTVSPYVFDPREKIQIQQKYIPEQDFINLVNKYKKQIEKYKLSYFEAFIGLTLIYFAEKKVDYAVVEVGLGGRLDATNVFKDPDLVIITNIGLDHTQQLGNTVAKIRKEKEAIIKNKKKAIKGQRLKKGEDFIKHNQELAIQAARFLKIEKKYIKPGLKKVKHPGRFEVVKKKPLVIRDGAHNPDKIQALANILPEVKGRRYLVMAIKDTKDYKAMLKIIAPYFDEVVFTSFSFKSYDPKILQREVEGSKVIKQPKQAYQKTLKKLKSNDLLVVTGSLYLLGEIFKK